MALLEIFSSGGISRVELAGRLGLSSTAIGRIVRELENAALIGETDTPDLAIGRGRPATALELRSDGAYVIGTVISAFSQEITLLNLTGEIVASKAISPPDVSDGPATIRYSCAQINALIERTGVPRERVACAGFAVAVTVDSDRGTVIAGRYIGWKPFDLSALARQLLGMPIAVNNVAASLLRAETFFGCARESRSAVLIHSATILGASFSCDGQLIPGAQYQAGRIGHFPARQTRLVCSCGLSDCLNCTASGWAVLKRIGVVNEPNYQASQVQFYARELHNLVNDELGDRVTKSRAHRVLREAGIALAKGLRYLELTFDPDLLILAGSLASTDAYFAGVMKGLQTSGPAGVEIARKLTRGNLRPAQAAGLTALQDGVFSPNLDLPRLAGIGATSVKQSHD